MSDFSTRHGYQRQFPARKALEQDSATLRGLIWKVLSRDGRSSKEGYQALLQLLGELPDPNVWSDSASTESATRRIDELHWIDVYSALEDLYSAAPESSGIVSSSAGRYGKAQIEAAANDALARSGLAYVMTAGKFFVYEPEAIELKVNGAEREALTSLEHEFSPVRAQYLKALEKLAMKPADLEGAVADALNALEAVAKIITGDSASTLGKLTPKLFPEGEGYHQILREAISKLYGFSSAVPGVRHGRYAEPSLAYAEVAMVIRLAGAIMVFLIADYRSQEK